jgi:hypothetical protein
MGISKRQQLEVMMTSVAVLSGGFEAGRDPGVAVEQAADDVKFADAPFSDAGGGGCRTRQV